MSIAANFKLQSGSVELLQWSVRSGERETVVALAGEIDLGCDETLNRLLADVVAGDPAKVVIDLTKVTFLDSTGIRQLVIAANATSDHGGMLVVRHPNATITRTLEICGLHDLLLEDSNGNAPEDR